MDYNFAIKKEFLNQTIGEFASKMGKLDLAGVTKVVRDNTTWYVPSNIINRNTDKINSLFNLIDGRVLNGDDIVSGKTKTKIRRRDGLIEKQELLQFVKDYFRVEKGKIYSDQVVSGMNIAVLIDIAIIALSILESRKKNQR